MFVIGGVSGLLMLQQPIVLNPNPAENAASQIGTAQSTAQGAPQWQPGSQPTASTPQVNITIQWSLVRTQNTRKICTNNPSLFYVTFL